MDHVVRDAPRASPTEAQPDLIIFGLHAAGAQAELKPSVCQEIDRCGFTRYEHRMAEIVVEHVRSNRRWFVASAARTSAGIRSVR
jgi:hypothetical protein